MNADLFLNQLAILTALISVMSGLWIMGRPKLWEFPNGVIAYLHGNHAAWLYLVLFGTVTISTLHFMLLLDWLLREDRSGVGQGITGLWMGWHILLNIFLTAVHVFIRRSRENGCGGKRNVQ